MARIHERNVNLKTMTAKDLVARYKGALRNCEQPSEEEGSFLDYWPPVAVYNWISGESDEREEREAQAAQVRNDWCVIAALAKAELNRRRPADVKRATEDVEREAVETFGPRAVMGPDPPPQVPIPTTSQAVTEVAMADLGSVAEKFSPFYWLGRAYEGVVDAVGLGANQTAEERVVGLVRLGILVLIAVLGAAAAYRFFRMALGFGAASQQRLISAAPTLAKLA